MNNLRKSSNCKMAGLSFVLRKMRVLSPPIPIGPERSLSDRILTGHKCGWWGGGGVQCPPQFLEQLILRIWSDIYVKSICEFHPSINTLKLQGTLLFCFLFSLQICELLEPLLCGPTSIKPTFVLKFQVYP